MGSRLDNLSKQLHTSQGKLEVLQQTTVHVKDDKQVRKRTLSTDTSLPGNTHLLLLLCVLASGE